MKDKYLKYSIKQIKKQMLTKSLEHNFFKNGYEDNLNNIYKRTGILFKENIESSKCLKYHLNQIIPCIAFYEELIKIKGSIIEAEKMFDSWAYDELYKMSRIIKIICKFGLYKKVPKLFDYFFNKLFNEEAGFKSNNLKDSPIFSRDIIICPYNEICKKYGHPELTKYFCKSDNITYSSIHPKLEWQRTKTLGNGGDCCDFRVFLKE